MYSHYYSFDGTFICFRANLSLENRKKEADEILKFLSDSTGKSISFLLNRLIVISIVTFVTSEMVVNDVNVLN